MSSRDSPIGAGPGVVVTALDELRRLAGPLFGTIERMGLAIVVTAPHLPDNPIVFVNAGFTALTGYDPADVLGRNCRLLQGPQTDPQSVQDVRAAIYAGRRIETKILNYRKNGEAFWNSLSITPVLDANRGAAFFISTQVDVTAADKVQSAELALQSNMRKLSEVNERLRVVLSISGAAAAWEWHINERRIEGDAGFAALYGLKTQEAIEGVTPQIFFALIHPDDRNRIRLAVGGMLHGAEVFSKEYRLLLNDGSVRWVHARGRCHYDENDKPARFSGVLVDITEQKRVEEQLRIAQTAGGIGTFEFIDGFGTVSVSSQFCSLLGLNSARVLPVRTVNSVVHPGDRLIIDQRTRPKSGLGTTAELRIVRADDRKTRWIVCRGEYLNDAETAGIRFSGVIYDITETKQIEEELRTLNETLEVRVEERTRERDRIWRVSRDIYALCDKEGRCRTANPAWNTELAYHATEVQARLLSDFVDAGDRSLLAAAIQRVGRDETVENLDLRMISKSGEKRTFSWSFVPEGTAFFAAGRDITERNLLEEQLRQSQKMEAVGQLTGGIAHDFNNLLTGITASLDLVRRRMKEGRTGDLDRFIDAATTSAQRAASLTHRLLAFSRRQSLDIKALDVNALVVSMVDMLHRSLGEQINLSVSLSDSLWLGVSDINQLENALLNLAINARDAMSSGGKLHIETTNISFTALEARSDKDLDAGNYIAISVTDTGTGMPADIVEKAFDPFFTTKPIGQGTGLGLSMIYGFAKQSGGSVKIESAPGQGTTVRLYIPRYTGDILPEVLDRSSLPIESGNGETILVVEDDPSVRLSVLELLREFGYRTLEATDSISALSHLRALDRTVDLMVSDVGLPGVNGRQLAEAARQARPELKILFITGYAQTAAVRGDFLTHGMDLLLKPFAVDVLANKIREMLRSTRD